VLILPANLAEKVRIVRNQQVDLLTASKRHNEMVTVPAVLDDPQTAPNCCHCSNRFVGSRFWESRFLPASGCVINPRTDCPV
jgi:hypothetical protein